MTCNEHFPLLARQSDADDVDVLGGGWRDGIAAAALILVATSLRSKMIFVIFKVYDVLLLLLLLEHVVFQPAQ